MQKHMEFHPGVERGQGFIHHGERRRLRGKQTAKTNQDHNEAHVNEVHPRWFDFTLGTA
jgi:hypothetical protein